jgi:hypothetical protein
MPIQRRSAFVVKPAPRWTHRVTAKHFTAHFQVSGGDKVIASEPVIHWTMGQRLDHIRELCNQRGYTLEKVN